MTRRKLILFDLDGVLVDVSSSYLEAVRKTAGLFLLPARGGAGLPDPLFAREELDALKQAGGYNNDWDLTAQVLSLLMSRVKRPAAFLHNRSSYRTLIASLDLSDLAAFLCNSSRPLGKLFSGLGRHRDEFVAFCYQGDVASGNVIKRIFQELYLGETLFKTIYGLKPEFFSGPGLIANEKPFAKRGLLEDLSRRHILAIATGRPRAEAEYTLGLLGIRGLFKLVLTLDHCLAEEERAFKETGERVSLSKPHPYLLDLAAETLKGSFGDCFYLGDLPDDMEAARRSRAGFQGIGVTVATKNKAGLPGELLKSGARRVIDDLDELPRLLA